MTMLALRSCVVLLFFGLSAAAQNVPLKNWTTSSFRHVKAMSDLSNISAFVAIAPCRVVDTRNANGTYGGPSYVAGAARSYSIPGSPCTGIPPAAAYSLNFTIVNYATNVGGFLTAYPTGSARPNVSTVNFGTGPAVANAAIVPGDGNGSIDVFSSGATHIIIDINGYFPDSRASNNYGEQLSLFGTVDGSAVIRGQNLSSFNSGFTSGVRGVVSGSADNITGVFGETVGSGANFGVKGGDDVGSADSAGVLGYVASRTNYNGSSGAFYPAGVRGEDGTASVGIGVMGFSQNVAVAGELLDGSGNRIAEGWLGSGPLYGVFSYGNTGATGTKSFIEPHPTDASKVIRYVSLEGPEAGTYFRGRGRFVNRQAVIDVPDNFRMVTEEEGLTVNITPMGGIASVGVISTSLDQIVAESSRDVEFSFIVYGVRRGYKDFEPIADGNEFVPRSPEEHIPMYLNAVQKQHLIDNGTYNADGTINMKTALRLGWDKVWAAAAAASKTRPPSHSD
jgi:hypothetical protein